MIRQWTFQFFYYIMGLVRELYHLGYFLYESIKEKICYDYFYFLACVSYFLSWQKRL